MDKTLGHLYGSDLERRAERELLHEVDFKEQKMPLGKKLDLNYNQAWIDDSHTQQTSSISEYNQSMIFDNPKKRATYSPNLIQDEQHTGQTSIRDTGDPIPDIQGVDSIVFMITSDYVLSKVNQMKQDRPEWIMFYPDISLNSPLSLTVPIFVNMGAMDTQYTQGYRLLDFPPSELVDIKQKVINALGLGIAPPIGYGYGLTTKDIEERLKYFDNFWSGLDKYGTIQILSVKHHAAYSETILPRVIIDFVVKTPELANMISSPELANRLSSVRIKRPLENVPTNSELEIRLLSTYSPPLSIHRPHVQIDQQLLLALGVPKKDLAKIDPQSFSITSVDFIC